MKMKLKLVRVEVRDKYTPLLWMSMNAIIFSGQFTLGVKIDFCVS